MPNLFHNIIVVKSVSTIFVSCTVAITRKPQILTYAWLWRKNGGTEGFKGSTTWCNAVAAVVDEKPHLGDINFRKNQAFTLVFIPISTIA